MFASLKRRFARGGAEASPSPAPEWLVVGLGNPGPKYASTRHNVGFRIVEALAARHAGSWQSDRDCNARLCRIEIGGRRVALLAPLTFMNRSGESVEAALARWPGLDPTRDLVVAYDDLDLPIGRIRLRPGGGPGGHNGIGDILERLGTRDVPRLRFGIDHPGGSGAVIDWVLTVFSAEDESERLPPAIERAALAIEAVVAEGFTPAMGRFNAAPTEGAAS